MEGRVSEEDYARFSAAYQVNMKGPLFCCIVFHTSENHVPEGMNPLLLSMSVEREIRQRLVEKWHCKEFLYLGNTVLIMEMGSEEQMVPITDECDRFCRWAYRVMGAVVTAGIGTVCDNLFNINLSYEGAREAVSYRVLYGTQRAINIREIVPKEQATLSLLEEGRMHDLFRAIRVGNPEKIEEAVQKEIQKIHKHTVTIDFMDERDGPDDQRGIKNREKQHVAPSCDGGAAACQREVYGRIHIAGCGLLYSRCIELIFFFRIQKGNRQIVYFLFDRLPNGYCGGTHFKRRDQKL